MKKAILMVTLFLFSFGEITFAQTNDWIVEGRVTNNSGNALPGLIVRAFDKDPLMDDMLGKTITDKRCKNIETNSKT